MIAAPELAEVQRFREAIVKRVGLTFRDDQLTYLSEVMGRRLAELGCRAGSYLEQLEEGPAERGEWERLADDLTVGETFFFRNSNHFQAVCEQVVPELVRGRGASTQPLRVLSAGCSSGEEPYSLAMALESCSETLGSFARSVTAFDLNTAALERARAGRYSAWSLRETGADWRARFFQVDGQHFLLDPRIRGQVDFAVRNLLHEDPGFWRPASFELIFCRNVLMYLLPSIASAVVARFARALVPGGYLFLGHAETLRGLSTSFELCNTHGTFYYRMGGAGPSPGPRSTPTALPAPGFAARAGMPSPALPGPASTAWIGSIGRSADRVATLAGAASRPAALESALATPSVGSGGIGDLQREVVELVRQERHHQAAAALASLTPALRREPLSRVLLAAVQLQLGELGRAEGTCQELLAACPGEVRGLFLMGLLREQAGDLAAATEHYRAAAAGASSFALPHLRLGLLARRERQDQQARLAFAQALALIAQEDDLNLALFSGGFTRGAIAELCRRQAGGGAP